MAEIPEDLKIMAREIVAMESACIEWGATAERSIELVAERLMEIREAEQMFAKASESTIRERVRELEAQVAALDWKPIAPESLPKVGDESWSRYGEVHATQRTLSLDPSFDAVRFHRGGWTHYRPINPPVNRLKERDNAE